ncbi:MAG: LTA synthase family protein [Lachnospiraceae bacterium]
MKYIKKPDIRGFVEKLKHLKIEDIKAYWKQNQQRREDIIEKRRNSEFAKKMQPVYKIMNRFSLIFQALWALMLNFIIEVISRHSLFQAWDYMVGTPTVFFYNAFLIFCTFSIVYLTKRRLFTRIIVSVFWLLLGISNGYMLMKRVTPFNAQDLKVAKDAVTLINSYFNGFELIVLVVGIAAVVVWLVSMWKRGGQYAGKMHRVLAALGVAGWFALFMVTTTVAIDKRVVSTYFGNIAFAYEDYGFPYCFMSSIFNTGITEPNGYSKETIMNISNNGKITESTTGRTDAEKPNIIFIQLESFFDTNELEFLKTSEDPLPNMRKLFQNYSSGYFKVPSVGAGTANTEFEVLTGMNLRYFGPGEYPYKTILKDGAHESAATALASLGYGTHALHNNGGNFYSRAEVFNNIGFDSFTSKEFMNILQVTEKGWAKDSILTQHIVEAMDSTQQEDFVFGISVQGHGDYPEEKMIENPRITVNDMEDEAKKNKWEYYVNQVFEMDQFVGDLIETMKKRNEPTVIVFYGDHLPTMGLEAEDMKGRYLYNTNYAIWDNIGLEQQDKNLASYQVMSEVFNRLDIHAGTVFNYHQARRKSKNYLLDLELLQYDILYGKQYVYQGHLPITEGHMQMGLRNVTLSEIIPHLDGSYSLYGDNFTKASKVYINDKKQKSTFLNNTRIELQEGKLIDGDRITVSQVGSSNTIFRTSKAYEYKAGKLTEVQEMPTVSASADKGAK